jgi:hypothetical protein
MQMVWRRQSGQYCILAIMFSAPIVYMVYQCIKAGSIKEYFKHEFISGDPYVMGIRQYGFWGLLLRLFAWILVGAAIIYLLTLSAGR